MAGHSTSPWYVYMIRTCGGRLYTGITVDVWRRWEEHCSGKAGAKFFRSDQPAALCLIEHSPDRGHASRREAAIKKLHPAQKQQLIRCQGPVGLFIQSPSVPARSGAAPGQAPKEE